MNSIFIMSFVNSSCKVILLPANERQWTPSVTPPPINTIARQSVPTGRTPPHAKLTPPNRLCPSHRRRTDHRRQRKRLLLGRGTPRRSPTPGRLGQHPRQTLLWPPGSRP